MFKYVVTARRLVTYHGRVPETASTMPAFIVEAQDREQALAFAKTILTEIHTGVITVVYEDIRVEIYH